MASGPFEDFIKILVEKDKELQEKLDAAQRESGEIYKIYQERLALYTTAEKLPTDYMTRILLSTMKTDIVHEVALFKVKKDFEEQVSQIVTRLDNIESAIQTINDKLNNINKKDG
jgi:prefoldin subunit 5